MSGLANLYNVPVSDIDRAQWAFAHMAHHRDINLAIYNLIKVALPEYILDPVNPNDAEQWEYQHQLMHDNQNQILGIEGQDLTGIDWKNPNLLAGWIWLNAHEHVLASNILEVN